MNKRSSARQRPVKKHVNPVVTLVVIVVVIVAIALVFTITGRKPGYSISKQQAEGFQKLIDKGYVAPAPLNELKKMGVKLPANYGQADAGWKMPPMDQRKLMELMEIPFEEGSGREGAAGMGRMPQTTGQ